MVKNTLFVFLVSIVSISNMFGSENGAGSSRFTVTRVARTNGSISSTQNNHAYGTPLHIRHTPAVWIGRSVQSNNPNTAIGRNVQNKNLSVVSSSADEPKATNNL